jgi:hypothetical protein
LNAAGLLSQDCLPRPVLAIFCYSETLVEVNT